MKPVETMQQASIAVASDPDIVAARQRGRSMAQQLGFRATDATLIATAISELARNILLYARSGEIVISAIERGERRGLEVTARDDGPGIASVALAMQDGYSTSGRLGLGLPGVRRLMDEFVIRSDPGRGTMVTVKKWNL
jgi:serine/threonine-protein kinase RsbT